MQTLRSRDDFDAYQAAFHGGDYETAFSYYADSPKVNVFGLEIDTPFKLRQLYRFLGEYVRETVKIERFAMSDELLAVEALVRVEGLRDLDTPTLREQGLYQFHPIGAGESQLMRHFIHYRLRDGRIESGSCVHAPS